MSELQEAVSRNVRVLIALRGIRSQRELAREVGVEYTNFNSKVRGKTAWTLDDIEKLAKQFRIRPASLFGDGVEFLDPNLRSTGTTGGTHRCVPATVHAVLIPFPQVDTVPSELSGLASVTDLFSRRPRPSLAAAV